MPPEDNGRMSEQELAATIYQRATKLGRQGEISIDIVADPSVRINTDTMITYWVPGMDPSNLNSRAGFASTISARKPRYGFIVALEGGFDIIGNSRIAPYYKFEEGPYKTPLRSLVDGKNVNGTTQPIEKPTKKPKYSENQLRQPQQ